MDLEKKKKIHITKRDFSYSAVESTPTSAKDNETRIHSWTRIW